MKSSQRKKHSDPDLDLMFYGSPPYLFFPELYLILRKKGLLKNFRPAIDMTENKKQVTIIADLPGCDPENVSLEIDDGNLIIQGTMEEETHTNDQTHHYNERIVGSFHRTIMLPYNADTGRLSYEYKQGKLTITFPKKRQKKKRVKIKIK